MSPTLEDVGRQCGVSRSTVSRVINDSPLVNEDTKRRVMKAIKELGYAPNFIARSLTRNRTETLAVTLPDITGGVYPEILAGMDEVSSQRGYHVLVVFLGGARPKTDAVEQLVTHRRVDAVLSVAGTVDDQQIKDLEQFSVPIIPLARKSPIKNVPSVLFDDFGGAKQATELLISEGRTKLVHIRGPEGNYDADERARGFREALNEAGLAFEDKQILSGDFIRESGARAITGALDNGLDIDGLFAGNDEMAIGAMGAFEDKGVSVPDDIAIVGFDDIDLARFVHLSTVRIPMRELGKAAAQLAFDMIDGKQPVLSVLLPSEVIARASCPGK